MRSSLFVAGPGNLILTGTGLIFNIDHMIVLAVIFHNAPPLKLMLSKLPALALVSSAILVGRCGCCPGSGQAVMIQSILISWACQEKNRLTEKNNLLTKEIYAGILGQG